MMSLLMAVAMSGCSPAEALGIRVNRDRKYTPAPPVSDVIGVAPAKSERAQRLARHFASICAIGKVTANGFACAEVRCESEPYPTKDFAYIPDKTCRNDGVVTRFQDVRAVKLTWRSTAERGPAPCIDVTTSAARAQRFCHRYGTENETIEMAWRLVAEIADAPFDAVTDDGP